MAMQTTLGNYGIPTRWEDTQRQQYSTDYDQTRTAREGMANSRQIANINQTPARLAHQRWKTVFPWMQQQFGSLMGGGTGGPTAPGGTGGQQPQINTGPVWGQQQIQQQVNAAQGRNNAALAGQQQAMNSNMAARGFGGNSPLAQALGTQMQMQTNAMNSTAAREIPWQSAQANAQHLLGTQQAAESQFASRQQEAIERQKLAMSPLLQLLGSFNFNG